MITQKAISTTLNPKSKAWNQQKEDRVQEQYLVFLVKREESRNFYVFFGFFFFFFWVFVREKKRRETLGRRENFKKMCVL